MSYGHSDNDDPRGGPRFVGGGLGGKGGGRRAIMVHSASTTSSSAMEAKVLPRTSLFTTNFMNRAATGRTNAACCSSSE